MKFRLNGPEKRHGSDLTSILTDIAYRRDRGVFFENYNSVAPPHWRGCVTFDFFYKKYPRETNFFSGDQRFIPSLPPKGKGGYGPQEQ